VPKVGAEDGALSALKEAESRVRRLRWLFAAAVGCRGVLAALVATIVLVDAALAAALTADVPGMVLPAAQALLSTAAVLCAVYVVVVPLRKHFPLLSFARRLEGVVPTSAPLPPGSPAPRLSSGQARGEPRCRAPWPHGAERPIYILAACDLARQSSEGRLEGTSQVLAEQVGERALADLRKVAVSTLPVFRTLLPLAAAFTVVLGVSLSAAMAWPEHLKSAAVRLLQEPARVPAGAPLLKRGAHPGAPGGGAAGPPPCRELKVTAIPPDYLRTAAIPLAWDQRGRVPAGSTIEVSCEPTRREAAFMLTRHEKQQVVSIPFQRRRQAASGAVVMAAQSTLTENAVFFVGRVGGGPAQPGRLEMVALPDLTPACALHQPAADALFEPNQSLSVLAEALDDHGIGSLTLYYRVEGLDETASPIELLRPADEKRVLSQREVPLSLFLADPGDRVTLFLEVLDNRETAVGEGACRTSPVTITIKSAQGDQREAITKLASLRDRSLDLLADGMAIASADSILEAPWRPFLAGLSSYRVELAALAQRMEGAKHFRGDDVRRLAALTSALADLLETQEKEPSQSKLRTDVGKAVAELEQNALNLDGVVEKLLGEYLFQQSGRVQAELSSIRSLSREAQLDAAGERTLMRRVKKIRRMAEEVVQLRRGALPVMRALFTRAGSASGADRYEALLAAAAALLDRGPVAPKPGKGGAGLAGNGGAGRAGVGAGLAGVGAGLAGVGAGLAGVGAGRAGVGGASLASKVDALSRAVEAAARSAEGAYTQSMNRLSSSFRTSRDEVEATLGKAAGMIQALRKQLDTVMKDVEEETREYILSRRTLSRVQEAAHKLRTLSRLARTFNSSLYPAVDRGQVAEFRQKLSEASKLVGLLRIEEASALSSDLLSLTQSMEFSLDVAIRYANDDVRSKKSRRELDRVYEARKLVSQAATRLSAIKPHREKLQSLQPERLDELTAQIDEVLVLLRQANERVDVLRKTFPVFFGRIAPAVERLVEAADAMKADMAALVLDKAYREVLFCEESLSRLQAELAAAAGEAKGAGLLAAGGEAGDLEVSGKGRTVSREKLESYQNLTGLLAGKEDWKRIAEEYFLLLSR